MFDHGARFFTPQRRREKKGMCLRTLSIGHPLQANNNFNFEISKYKS
jgi:hypothetical protein